MGNAALILILEVIILVCGAAFLHQKNPAGFTKVVDDFEQLVSSAVSGSNPSPAAPATAPESPPPASTANVTPAPAVPVVAPAQITPAAPPKPLYTPSPPPAPAPAAWAPPAVMPAQPNWIWTTIAGRVYTNVKVLSVDRDSVMIMYDGGGERVPLAFLPSGLQKLFNYIPPDAGAVASAGNPAPGAAPAVAPVAAITGPPPVGTSSVLGHMLSGNLVRYTTNGLQPVDDAQIAAARYVAVYYSAQWCPPCHAFTPKLVQFYNSFKPTHPDFDLVFVSEDNDENQMHDYMQEMAMPWPAIRYDQLQHPPGSFKGSGIESFANHGIPDLVLVDSTGKVLSDSFHGSDYVGPEAVVADIQSMVK